VYFEEGHIVRIANVCAKCLVDLREDNISHLNINPETILVTSGKFKLYHPLLLEPINSNKFQAQTGRKTFLAPEVVKYIFRTQNRQIGLSFDPTSADIFSIGLCMIEAASLEPERSYYTHEKLFDEALLRKKIRKLSHIYTKEFINLLCRMLVSEPSERIDM
jgi:serine/threonine protein kinase